MVAPPLAGISDWSRHLIQAENPTWSRGDAIL